MARHIFIDYRLCFGYTCRESRSTTGRQPGDAGGCGRVRFPRAAARHCRSRAAPAKRPAGTMTGLRGARWTGTGRSG
jgi:hypothetical protein